MKDYQEAAFNNWEERLRTMNIIYRRMIEAAMKINPNDAVSMTNSLCDEMMSACYFMEKNDREKQTNDLLETVFKKSA